MDDEFIDGEETNLTVRKTSLFFSGDGFTVYDCKGSLVFRVDSYGGPNNRDTDEVVLMDAHGRCLLTLRRKVATLYIYILFLRIFIYFSKRDFIWKLLSELEASALYLYSNH